MRSMRNMRNIRSEMKRVLSFGLLLAMMAQGTLSGSIGVKADHGTDITKTRIKGTQNDATTLDMQLYARYNSNVVSEDGGSLEIVEYNSWNGYAYAVSGVKGTLAAVHVNGPDETADIADMQATEYNIKEKISELQLDDSDFIYGDMTSVAVSPDGTKLAVAIQHKEYDKAGAIAIFTCDEDGSLREPKLYKAGIQPDMVAFADEETVLSADEGEPRLGYEEGTQDPEGSVTILDLNKEESVQTGFSRFNAEELAAQNVLIGCADGQMLSPAKDLEPEYISVSQDGSKAYVALQEANAVAVLDVEKKTFTGIYSVGFEDFSSIPVDLVNDGKYQPAVYENLIGARMPDGITSYERAGKTYLAIANEGDSREWGDYCNETKTNEVTGSKLTVLDSSKEKGIPEGKSVLFGGRGFTILEVTDSGLKEVYDSGADFESTAAEVYPSYFNCSNNDTKAESRSAKKGPEPENITISEIDGRVYAFIALERIGGIMAYDITEPEYSMEVNYINSRDFSSDIKGDVSPEGICTAVINNRPVVLAANEVSGTLAAYELTKQDADDIIVLFTNDVHNAYEKSKDCLGYASVAQYKKQLESLGYTVELVDNGDAIQGEVIGTISKGSYITDIMKQTGYSLAIPGNHEYDFGMETFLELAKEAEEEDGYQYISCNFIDLRTGKTVFEPYKIMEYGGKKVGYIGVSTPESFTKSTPAYFQDKAGNYIYGFCEGNHGTDLYKRVQETIDDVKKAGADYIVVMSHLGTDPSSEPWTSKDLIQHTEGIDVLLDGHSHSTITGEICKSSNGSNVLLASTGTKLKQLGMLRIQADGIFSSKLVDNISMQDTKTLSYVNDITAKFQDLTKQKVARSEINLTVSDPVTGNRLVRSQETNLGDLCADAYRELLGADIAFVNGGGVRANLNAGDITYGDIINVHPFGNKACLAEVTGQQIMDALELGARAAGVGENGGFLQVSGLTYDIDTTTPSSVVLDDKKMFVKVNGAYRVKNVKVGKDLLDLKKTYTLASHNYMLKDQGDGFSMFKGSKILQDEVKVDNQVLIEYITNTLGGVIKSDSIYANPYGAGRIRVITEFKAPTGSTKGYVKYQQGSTVKTETIEAEEETKHSHSYKSTVVPATVKSSGKIVTKCSCGITKTKVIYRIASASLSTTDYTYTGKSRKPSIKIKDTKGKLLSSKTDYSVSYQAGRTNAGKYSVKITLKGNYKGTITKTFTIRPKRTSVSKVKGSKKELTVYWKTQKSQTSGYQIQYSRSKKFTKHMTVIVNVGSNKLSAKRVKVVKSNTKYYVRVRTYKNVKVNGKVTRICSDWSEYKSAVTKK